MQANRTLNIAKASHRKSTLWQNTSVAWLAFVESFRNPVRTQELFEDFIKLKKTQQDELKDVGGFTGALLKDGRRKLSHIISRDLVCLDLDNIPTGLTQEILKKVSLLGCTALVYSTRKHCNFAPRLRLIIPLDESCLPDEYEPIARKIGSLIGIDYCDPTTFEVNRFMYYPSCSIDSDYLFNFYPGQFCSKAGVLKLYKDWRDITEWPHVKGQEVRTKQMLAKQQDPTTKNGLVGAFCKVYDIPKAIESFIPGLYEATAVPDRYTFTGGSTSGGAVVYDDKFLYSHHATDPCAGQLVNAFDLIRIHKFGDLDNEAKEGTPVNKLPSYMKMNELANLDKAVSALRNQETIAKAKDIFTSLDSTNTEALTDNLDWVSNLTRDNNGRVEKTINNIVVVLENDPNLKGKIALDIFSNRGLVFGKLPWDKHYDPQKAFRDWSEVDDASFSRYLESIYQISSQDKQDKALLIASDANRINHVEAFIKSVQWDGVPRLDTLYIDYFGAEDNLYVREACRKSLVAAVARAIVGGVKFDVMTILTGPQGVGKSTFLRYLGGAWFSDSLQTFEGKEASELLQGNWIIEVGELNALNKHEVNSVKQFLSKVEDNYREAYGRRTSKFPRRCVFFGTSNDEEFLRDPTGNRRFWPIKICVNSSSKSVFKDLKDEVPQIWAEAYTRFILGESLILSEKAESLANVARDDHREISVKEGIIREFLEIEIPENFYKLDKKTRLNVLNSTFRTEGVKYVKREKICAAEVFVECFGGKLELMTNYQKNEINTAISNIFGWFKVSKTLRFGAYGVQRGFIRGVTNHVTQV